MIAYVITFFYSAILAMLQPVGRPWKSWRIWIPAVIYLVIFIGFRHEVGSDWGNYIIMYHRDMPYLTYYEALTGDDPAFYAIMLWVYNMGWSIHVVNFISAIFFVIGLVVFARHMPNPWLMLVVATGYTMLTSGMGYVRHGVAFGFTLWAIVALLDRKFLKFFLLIALGATFHKSAVLVLGFGLFYGGGNRYLKGLAVSFMLAGMYTALIAGAEDHYTDLYLSDKLHSNGAYIRTFMNVIPALIFFYFRRRWKRIFPMGYELWRLLAIGAVLSVPAVLIFSTATDRISVYLIPLQFVVFSHLPLLLRGVISPSLTTSLVISYYAAVYFVWLLFASWAFAWVPYQSILIEWFDIGTVTHVWD
jgi:hypothetical protein